MILITRPDGKILNLTAAKVLTPMRRTNHPEDLLVEFSDDSRYIVEDLNLQYVLDHSAGRVGPVIFRRYFRREHVRRDPEKEAGRAV